MGEPIQVGAGEALGDEDLGPLLERELGGDHEALPLVGLADEVEQDRGAGSAHRDVGWLAEDQKVPPRELRA